MGNENIRRRAWNAGVGIQCALEYWNGEEWARTGANIDITERTGDTAKGTVASTGATTTGRFDGQVVTIDIVRGIARVPVQQPAQP